MIAMKWLAGTALAIWLLPWYISLPLGIVLVGVASHFGKDSSPRGYSGYDVPGGSAGTFDERYYDADPYDYDERSTEEQGGYD